MHPAHLLRAQGGCSTSEHRQSRFQVLAVIAFSSHSRMREATAMLTHPVALAGALLAVTGD
jgi:hypothetical protein